MQDRVPLYPGRVKMTPVAGQANTFDMVRADDPTQAGTPLNKATFLKDATAALYGLGTGAVPDDVLAELGKYKQYWWRRRLSAGERFTEQKTSLTSSVSISGNNSSWTIKLAKSITINQSTGAIELSSPENYEMTNISYETAKALALKGPCYITNLKGATSDVYYIPANATTDTGAFANNSTATLFYYEDSDGDTDFMILGGSKANPPGQKVTSAKTNAPAGDWEYVQSSNRNAYPDSGEVPISSTWVEHRENNSDTLLEYNNTYSYAAEITIDQSTGGISLVAPNTTTATDGDAERNFIKSKAPCYLTTSYSPSKIYYVPAGATSGTSYTNTLQGNGFPVEFGSAGNPHGMVVTAVQKTINYEYEYLGIPFDNAVTAPKIETGSYVGTGTYGKANPNTLTFGFVPKFVWIYGFKRNDAWYDAGDVTKVPVGIIPEGDFGRHFPPCSSTESSNTAYSKRVGTTLSWYNTGSAGDQLNYSDSTYYYIAIG